VRPIPRPRPGEYAPDAARYLRLLPQDDRILDHLAADLLTWRRLMRAIPRAARRLPYGPGKWTALETLLHLCDDERIYAYRALRFARADRTDLPGFEQDPYVRASGAQERTAASLLAELTAVRRATLALYAFLPAEALAREGTADGHRMTVRAIAYHVAGHARWHAGILRRAFGLAE
jgi:hypothetical protein